MYEIFEKLCKAKGIKPYRFEKDMKVSSSTVSTWKAKNSLAGPELTQKVCDYFGITADFLMGKSDTIECKECGQKYNPLDKFDCAMHEQFHSKILNAQKKYACLFPYSQLASICYDCLKEIRNGSENIAIELDKYLKAEFSYYVYTNYEDNKHFDFFDFAKSKVVEMINAGDIPQDQINNVVAWYGLNKDYINIQGATLARASKNPQLMRLLAYAEKLNPETLNMLEIQAKALAEQNSKNEE